MKSSLFTLIALLLLMSCSDKEATFETEIAVVGGGASGVTAALQAARLG